MKTPTAKIVSSRHVSGPKRRRGLGDIVHSLALPLARALKLSCVDPATKQLRPESGCAKRRARWNKIGA
jgi:hypothetical protein